MEQAFIYDTTFRDGTQGEDISFSAKEKLKIAKKLDDIGIHYIEGGFAGSNPRDTAFFNMAKKEHFTIAKIAAFGSTRKPGIRVQNDANLKAVLEADTPVAAIVANELSIRPNFLKSLGKSSLAIPGPVSAIKISTIFFFAFKLTVTLPPIGANFKALPKRFISTSRILSSSARTFGKEERGRLNFSNCFFSCA